MTVHATDLAESIRTRVLTSDLPRDLRTPVVTGPGNGLGVCGCCSEPIPRLEMQHDVEQRVESGPTALVPMHSDCYRLWRHVVETLYLLDGAAGVGRVPAW
jgi:hypothetical protein